MKDSFERRKALANWESAAAGWAPRPPLSPGQDDIAWYECAARETAIANARPRALLLGVTSGVATMDWPQRTALVAVDWAAAMIENVWPRSGLPKGAVAIRADWHALPLADNSREFAAGDGCYTAVGGLDAAEALNREVSRVLVPGGTLAIRCFCRTEVPPDVDQLFDDLLSGRQTDLGLFRWLLIMALQGQNRAGVRLGEVWRVWHAHVPSPEALQARFGWISGDIGSLERYAGQDVYYVFPTIDELHEIAAPCFDVAECSIPDYEYGRHFPRLKLINKA